MLLQQDIKNYKGRRSKKCQYNSMAIKGGYDHLFFSESCYMKPLHNIRNKQSLKSEVQWIIGTILTISLK